MSNQANKMKALYIENRRKHKKLSSLGGIVSGQRRKEKARLKYLQAEELNAEFQEIQRSTNEDICPID